MLIKLKLRKSSRRKRAKGISAFRFNQLDRYLFVLGFFQINRFLRSVFDVSSEFVAIKVLLSKVSEFCIGGITKLIRASLILRLFRFVKRSAIEK